MLNFRVVSEMFLNEATLKIIEVTDNNVLKTQTPGKGTILI